MTECVERSWRSPNCGTLRGLIDENLRWVFIDQAKATGGAYWPPPNNRLARSVFKKNIVILLGSTPATPMFSTSAVTRLLFLSVSLPEETSTSIIKHLVRAGLGQGRIVRIHSEVAWVWRKEALEKTFFRIS